MVYPGINGTAVCSPADQAPCPGQCPVLCALAPGMKPLTPARGGCFLCRPLASSLVQGPGQDTWPCWVAQQVPPWREPYSPFSWELLGGGEGSASH